MKLKRHKCKSYYELRRLTRKYFKYWYNTHPGLSFYNVWLSYEVRTIWDAIKVRSMHKPTDNLYIIMNEFMDNYHKQVYVTTRTKGELNGILITHEDYYYIIGDRLASCVGGFKLVN